MVYNTLWNPAKREIEKMNFWPLLGKKNGIKDLLILDFYFLHLRVLPSDHRVLLAPRHSIRHQ